MSAVISSDLLHSGCKYNLQLGETCAANSSPHLKSVLLKTMIFSSFAKGTTSGNGALNFFGERHIQSHDPESGEEPEVSIFVCKPTACNLFVSVVRLCSKGSPPVTTTSSAGVLFTCFTSSSIFTCGCLLASQLSFTSHQTQPTSHPPKRIKYAARPW